MSYLSSYVKKVFVDSFIVDQNEMNVSSPVSLCMALNKFDIELKHFFIVELQTKQDFLNVTSTYALRKFFHETKHIKLTVDELNFYSDFIPRWLTSFDKFQVQDWFETCKTPVEKYLNLLQITAALEYSLGNFYLMKQRPCPFLLRDLIHSEELTECFGANIMKFLTLLFGGPLSLNLRNLLWHGFVAELEVNEVYFASMIFVLVYLASCISERSLLSGITIRSFIHKTTEMQLLNNQFCKKLFVHVNLKEIFNLFQHSPWIPSSFISLYRFATELFFEHRYGDCVLILLPRIECLLRHLYTWCNKCPERILTAESTEFYTAIDQVMQKSVPDDKPNRINQILDEHLLVLIMDLFVLPEGLRLRDHLSHGEMKPNDVDENTASVIILLAALLSHQNPNVANDTFAPMDIKPMCEELCPCRDSKLFRTFHDVIVTYHSLFHPLSFAKRNALLCLDDLQSLSLNNADSALPASEEHKSLCASLNALTSSYLAPFTDKTKDVTACVDALKDLHLKTLHRSHPNDVIIRKISAEVLLMKNNLVNNLTQKTALYQARQMRSRQRKNYQRFIDSFPVLTSTVKLLSCFVISLVHQTEKLGGFSTSRQHFSSTVIFHCRQFPATPLLFLLQIEFHRKLIYCGCNVCVQDVDVEVGIGGTPEYFPSEYIRREFFMSFKALVWAMEAAILFNSMERSMSFQTYDEIVNSSTLRLRDGTLIMK